MSVHTYTSDAIHAYISTFCHLKKKTEIRVTHTPIDEFFKLFLLTSYLTLVPINYYDNTNGDYFLEFNLLFHFQLNLEDHSENESPIPYHRSHFDLGIYMISRSADHDKIIFLQIMFNMITLILYISIK